MRRSSGFVSLLLHGLGVLALLSLPYATTPVPQVRPRLGRDAIPLAPLHWRLDPGGGGQREQLPASKGVLPPRSATKIFTPPTANILNENPKLPEAQAIVIDPDIPLPEVRSDRIGSPFGVDGPLPGGPGGPYGIGDHGCCGVGNENGRGAGGSKNGMTAKPARTRVTRKPQVIYQIEPEYSEEARKARFQGIVIVAADIGTDGRPHDIRVVRPLGLGLDERALEAVARWRFRPAMSEDRPVDSAAVIEVTFRLL